MKFWIIKISVLIAALPIVLAFSNGASCDFYYLGENKTTGVNVSFICERGRAVFSVVDAEKTAIYRVEGRYYSLYPDYFFLYTDEVYLETPDLELESRLTVMGESELVRGYWAEGETESVLLFYYPEQWLTKGHLRGQLGLW
ncbi:hypothetical protein J4N42_15440 [Vibrio sp. SCSIO 43135]|uniref:hypothetical protein n=1 Tax=Vibrio sp. SCSIO 43135 TaxID=2819096 RepID=UPI002074AF09|nr:hypothetical protein [Vibrio sp. SCSIO 43135]USD43569.1 hypothetical protein J4N42_15440 [Vibrio sp. SCSIO 43135]